MKNTTLPWALTLAAACSPAALAATPTFYGKINVSLQAIEEERLGTDTQDNWELRSNTSRLGVKGSLPINDTLKAIYKLEYEVFADDGQDGSSGDEFKQRNIYGGLQGNFGTVIFGKHDTPAKLTQGKVDRFNHLYAADIKYLMAGEQRENNIVIYSSPKLNDTLAFSLAFMPGEDDESTANPDDGLADYISASVTYQADRLYLAVGADLDVDNTDLVRLVGEYKADAFTVGAILQSAEQADDNEGGLNGLSGLGDYYDSLLPIEDQDALLVSGELPVDDKLSLRAQFGYSESSHTGISDDTELALLALGADYRLSQAAKFYAYLAQVDAENDAAGSDSEDSTIGIGYELKF